MGKMIFATLFVLLSIGMSMNYLSGSTLRSYLQMKNAYLAQAALNQLKQKMLFDSGHYMAPLGEDGERYHELPLSLLGSRLAAKGSPFMYCPYGQSMTATANAEIQDASGERYVAVKEVVSGVSYVRQSDAPPVSGLLAAIVLPQNGNPSCSDIDVSADGQWVLSEDSAGKGLVYAIHQDEMSYEGGQGLWLTASDSAGLSTALSKAVSSSEKHVVISLKPGETFVVSGTYDFSGLPDGATVELRSSSPTATINSSSLLELQVPYITLLLENVNLSTSVFIESSFGTLKMKNAQSGPVAVRSGELNATASTFSAVGVPAVQLAGSTLRLSGDVEISSNATPVVNMVDSVSVASGAQITLNTGPSLNGVQMVSSVWKMTTGSLNFPSMEVGSSAVYVDSGSSFQVSDGTLIVQGASDSALYIEGLLSMRSSTLQSQGNVAVHAGKTATMTLTSAQIGDSSSRAQIGINNLGARLSGVVSVYAVQCKSGDGFAQAITVNFDDDTVSFANPDGTVVPSMNAKSIDVPLFDKTNPIEIACL